MPIPVRQDGWRQGAVRVGGHEHGLSVPGPLEPSARREPPSAHLRALVHALAFRMVAVLAYAVGLAALVVWVPATFLLFLVCWPFDRNRVVTSRFYRWLLVVWSRSFPFWRIRIQGRWPDAGGPYVIVSNHQSFLDIFVLCNIQREWKWVAKRELFRIPMFGWGLMLTGTISLDRGDTASALAVMDRSRRYLADGISVMMFPEGTRSPDGNLLPFKPGAFKLAIAAGAPVLPIAVSGSADGMPKGTPWVRPARIVIRILDAVPTSGLTGRDVRRLRDAVRDRIAQVLDADGDVDAAPVPLTAARPAMPRYRRGPHARDENGPTTYRGDT